MTTERPTAELAEQVVTARAHLAAGESHLDEVREELVVLAEQMPTLPQMADIDMAIADLRNASRFLRHLIWSLGGKVTD